MTRREAIYLAARAKYPTLRGYALSIKLAVPQADDSDLGAIEDVMRHEIFHSTLDWVTPSEFDKAAHEAYEVVLALRTRYAGCYPPQICA